MLKRLLKIIWVVWSPWVFAEGPVVEKLTFSKLWEQARTHAPEIRRATHEWESAKIRAQRMGRHWYPQIFMEAGAFYTNDPTNYFMAQLGQRQIQIEDFSPTNLNHPKGTSFERGRLGIDWALFEGGGALAAAQSGTYVSEAKEWELKGTEWATYTQLAHSYGTLLRLDKEKETLDRIDERVKKDLKNYRIGNKQNPVGYSGLLGLKTLDQRVRSLFLQNESEEIRAKETIVSLVGNLPSHWRPSQESLSQFTSEKMAIFLNESMEKESFRVRALGKQVEAVRKQEALERAKFLPKVGLFGTTDLFAGERGGAMSATGGIYLRWNLFVPTQWGAVGEMEHSSAAMESQLDAERARARLNFNAGGVSRKVLEENLKILETTEKLMEEQLKTMKILFKNGSINALQLVETYSKRLELLESRSQAENRLLETYVLLLNHSHLKEL